MKTRWVFHGLPRSAGLFRFTSWKSLKRLSRTRVHEGRAAPHRSERSERAWTMSVRVAPAGAAADRLDGLTVHRSPCRWTGARSRCAAFAAGWRRLRFFGMRGRDRLRPPPPQSNQPLRADKPSTVPWVFTADLHGLPAPSRVLDLPCVTGRRGMSVFPEICIFSTGRTNPPSAQIRGGGLSCRLTATDKLRTFA